MRGEDREREGGYHCFEGQHAHSVHNRIFHFNSPVQVNNLQKACFNPILYQKWAGNTLIELCEMCTNINNIFRLIPPSPPPQNVPSNRIAIIDAAMATH